MKFIIIVLSLIGINFTSDTFTNKNKISSITGIKINLISASDSQKTEGSGSLVNTEDIKVQDKRFI